MTVFIMANMDEAPSPSVPKRDRRRDNFVRAMSRLMKRSNKVSQLHGADMYVLVRWKNRHWVYCSTEDQEFPPSPKAFDRIYPPVVIHRPADFADTR
ncbi:hypothetical protein BB8028_0007g00470 [Beauveria bassiana]|uniref:Uncharacterized protein n=1 Tax=Beauveria bassiana TaxID=176275 RepID=A0A2S7YKZ1_BEABA|nr:hypothetical protein BB8028_0007g00470 [Beauveria bassiana]